MSGKVLLLPISSILFQHLVPDTKQKKPQLMLNQLEFLFLSIAQELHKLNQNKILYCSRFKHIKCSPPNEFR